MFSYSFPVFLVPVARDLHASITAVTGALTVATLVSGAAAVPVGRWLDRHGGRALMTAGSVGGTLLLVAFANVHTVAGLYAVWTGIGLVCAMVYYESAFAVVVTWYPDRRTRSGALLAVTVVAGFASTIFLPLTGALVERYGWRGAALVLAAIHGAVTIPLHATVLRRAPERAPESRRRAAVRNALRDKGFWLLVAAFVAHAAALSAFTVHVVAFLGELGHSPAFAATVAGLLGVLSVTGRLVVTGLQRRLQPATVVAVVFGIQAVAVAVLPLVGRGALGAIVGVVGFGLGFGVATIARPALVAARYDIGGYASISGLLTVPLTVAKAVAPLAAAALRGATGDYTAVLWAVGAACAVAALGIAATARW